MSESNAKSDGFGSRIGYIVSTLGMAVGVGAMWRFPMKTALNGGGAFVLAFIIICLVCVIPAGWAESAAGRHYRLSAVGTFGEIAGGPGRVFGYLMALTPIGLMFYYPIIMSNVTVYLGYMFKGAPFVSDPNFYNDVVNPNKFLTYGIVVVIILLNAIISQKGIKGGIEKICKIMLPIMFIILLVIAVRIFTLDGISAGIENYVKPDWSQLASGNLWMEAAGMALFAVGLGPGYLLTYGMYVDKDADIATDFVTVTIVQTFICVLCGFAIIPAISLFGQEVVADKGLIFQILPFVFNHFSGGLVLFGLFMLALFFGGLSSTLAMMEIPVACLVDRFKMSRTKAIWLIAVVCCLGAIPCIWSDSFFTFFDNLIGNVFYCTTAAVVALLLAWYVGAKKIREEWYNPTSVIKYGSWVDWLYKILACGLLTYFAVLAIMSLF
jgi:NSS family neurotransmitter:Na+ symporter